MSQKKLLSLITSVILFYMCGEDPFMGHGLLVSSGGTTRVERRWIQSLNVCRLLFHDDQMMQ